MENFVQERYQEFLLSLEQIPNLKNPAVKNPAKISEVVKDALQDLKNHFTVFPFAGPSEQVNFFKYDKPKFYAEYIYGLELFNVESNRPQGDDLVGRNYYEQELKFIRRYFDQYRFLFQYYLLDGHELDEQLFTINAVESDWLFPSPEPDRTFSTAADFMFAKFLALERLQEYLISLIYPASTFSATSSILPHSLRWTGDKINLIELAYGIHNAAQVNDGLVSVGEIIAWLEASFQTKLSRYPQMYSEIKGRKSVSKTRFLDHMSSVINRHIEEGDAFVPQKPRPVSGSKSERKA